jgi:hypothetical protein
MIITHKSQIDVVLCEVSSPSYTCLKTRTSSCNLCTFYFISLTWSDKILWTRLFVVVCGLKLSFTRLAASQYSFHFNAQCHCVLPEETFTISDILHIECFIWPDVNTEYFAIQRRSVGLYDGYGVGLLRGNVWTIALQKVSLQMLFISLDSHLPQDFQD